MRLNWDPAVKAYEAGVDRGVLYVPNGDGVVWNGLTGITETKSMDTAKVFFEGEVIRVRNRNKSASGSVSAFTYPYILDGWQGKTFGLTYRVLNESGYSIHLLYGVKFYPSEVQRSVIGSEISPGVFSWQMSSDLHMVIQSTQTSISEVEDVLYGSVDADARIPDYEEVLALLESNATLKVTDMGNGVYNISGPDEAVIDNGDGTFTIDWPSVTPLGDDLYNIQSL